MERQPEYGIGRIIQQWVTDTLRASTESFEVPALVMSTDEGDYQTKLLSMIGKHSGVLVLVALTSIARGGSGLWTVGIEVETMENITTSRGSYQNATQWTALRYAEFAIARLHEEQMSTAPYAVLWIDDNAITLEEERPTLRYKTRFQARLGANLQF